LVPPPLLHPATSRRTMHAAIQENLFISKSGLS